LLEWGDLVALTCRYKRLAIVGLGLLWLLASGCPLLMVGSLGYEGYEYDKTGHLPGMPPAQSDSSHAQSTPSGNHD